MKKHICFLASVLSLVLILSLCAPALAAEGQFTADGEPVPVVSPDVDPEDYMTVNVQDLLDSAADPGLMDASLSEDDIWASLAETTLYANGTYIGGERDGVVVLEDGVSYADAATLNAVLGTDLVGDKLPIREAANAAGWDVVWNQKNRQAALVDRESLMALLSEKLGGLEAILTKLRELQTPAEGKSMRTVGQGTMTFTQFNTLDGDATVKATGQVEVLRRDGVVNETLSFHAGELLALLPDRVRTDLAYTLSAEEAAKLEEFLDPLTVSLIQDQNEGVQWLSSPMFSLVDESFGEDAWLALGAGTAASFNGSLPETVYQMILDDLSTSYLGVDYAWKDHMERLERIFPAGVVTLSNGGLTWTLNTAGANEALSKLAGEEISFFKECDVALSVTAAGKLTFDLAYRLDDAGLAAADSSSVRLMSYLLMGAAPDFRLTCHIEANGKTSAATIELHVKNQFKAKLDTKATITETTDLPVAAPPEGAQIIER